MAAKHTLVTEILTGHRDAHARCRGCGWTGNEGAPRPPLCPNDPHMDAEGELMLLNVVMAPHAWQLRGGTSALIDSPANTLEILARDTTPFAQAVQDAGFISAGRARHNLADSLESAAEALQADSTIDAVEYLRTLCAELRR